MFKRPNPEAVAAEANFVKIRHYLRDHPNKTITLPVDGSNLPEGKPNKTEFQCGCGGTLKYGEYSFKSSLNGEEISIPAMFYYACSNLDCRHKIALTEVTNELGKRIIAARQSVVESGILEK